MAITLVKGRPGAGKSYEVVVNHIIPNVKEGRKVVTNIPLNIDHFVLIFGESVKTLLEVVPFDFDGGHVYLSDPEDYKKYQDWKNEKGQGCLFVLDECHLMFPLSGRGKGQSDLAERQIRFFSGHRHYGFDFIFLTQSDKKLNRLLREDIEICIEVRKNRAISDNAYRRYVYYYGDGKKGGLIEQDSRKYEKQFFPFYKSHTKSDGDVKEANVKDMKRWHQSWGLRITTLLLVVGMIMTFNVLSTMFGEKETPTVKQPSMPASSPEQIKPASSPKLSQQSFQGLPFGSFEIFIEGYSDSSYVDDNGIYHLQKQVYFSAQNQSNFQLALKLDDFYLAGYEVSVYGPCMVRLTYGESTKLVYCRGHRVENDSVIGSVASIAS